MNKKKKKGLPRLIVQIIAAIAGLYLAARFVSQVSYGPHLKTLLIAGLTLGLLNFFLRPILRIVTTPLRILTFGLFSIIVNGAMVWLTTALLTPLQVPLILPLLYTTLIIGLVNLFLNLFY